MNRHLAPTTVPSLTLYVPGLFRRPPTLDAESSPALSPPALETWLVRSDAVPIEVEGFERRLFALFGVDASERDDVPVAVVSATHDLGVAGEGWWIRADPVHLQPERDRLVLLDASLLALSQDETDRLVAEIAPTYAPEGWVLRAPRPDRWYLSTPTSYRLRTTPLSQVLARDIHPSLPQGPDGQAWRRVLNEMQLLLHASPVNREREARGELPINSLWLWGSGTAPAKPASSWTHVWSDDPLSEALAAWLRIPCVRAPSRYPARVASDAGNRRALVVLDMQRLSTYGDVERWSEALLQLDREWIEPLLHAVRRKRLSDATLVSDSGPALRLTARGIRRWWRRRRPIEAYR